MIDPKRIEEWKAYEADTLLPAGELGTNDRIFAFQRLAWDAFPALLAERAKAESLATAVEHVLDTDMGHEWNGTHTPEEAAIVAVRAALEAWRVP